MPVRSHASRTRSALLVKPVAAALALAFSGTIGMPASAATIDWIDWVAKTPTGLLGTIRLGDETVNVTFTGPYTSAFTDNLPEGYWGPTSTYTNSQVSNAPPRSDMIFIGGGPELLTLSFSQPVPNPIFAIASLGLIGDGGATRIQSSMEFERSFEVLSNGRNYYGNGLFTLFGSSGNTLTGVESSGTVRLPGNADNVQWRSPLREEVNGVLVGTYGFNLGVNCEGYRVGPSPLTTAGSVARGCTGFNDSVMAQQDGFELRGRLDNRAGARWVQGGPMNVAESGRLLNAGTFIVGEGQTLASRGQLSNSSFDAQFDVRGTLLINAGTANNFGYMTLRGDNTLPTSGRMEVASPASFMSAQTFTLEQGSRLVVAGAFDNSAQLLAEAFGAVVQVRATGTLITAGIMSVGTGARSGEGGLDNRGLVRVAGGGELRLAGSLTAEPNVLNRGTLEVQTFGVLRLAGPTDPNAVVGSVGMFRNADNGTVNLNGLAELAGTFDNAGLVRVGTAGDITTNGPFGTFSQGATGQLNSLGRIELAQRGSMMLGGQSTVSGLLQVNPGSQLTVAAGGTLRMQPQGAVNLSQLINMGTMRNQGTLLLLGAAGGGAGGFGEHRNEGTVNNSGLLRIGGDAILTNAGGLENSGRFQIDAHGLLFATSDGSSVMQTASGVFVNNGTVTSPGNFVIFGGRVSGSGTFETSVSFGDLSFEPGDNSDLSLPRGPLGMGMGTNRSTTAIAPTFQTGTMRFTGDLVLGAGTTARLKFSEHGGGDRLVVGGALVDGGGTLNLVFPTNSAPGLDQVFTFFESPNGWSGNFDLNPPAGYEITHMDLLPGAGGVQRRGAVFTVPGAREFDATNLGFLPGVVQGEHRFIQTSLSNPAAHFDSFGMLGIRNLPGTSLRVGRFDNQLGASLLNSASFTADHRFINLALVKNREGAEFINLGRLENRAGATLENRGLLVNGPAGSIINQGHLVLYGELRDESLLAAAGQLTVTNDGGRVDIQASGRVLGSGAFEQRGANAATHVDGLLQAASIFIAEGSLGGNGRVSGALSMSGNARLEPGNSVGTLSVEGSIITYGSDFVIELASLQSFDKLVVIGDTSLSGTARFRLIDGFAPQVGDSWMWLAVSGGFSLGLAWRVEVPGGATGWTLLADAGGTYDTQGLLPERAYFEFNGDTLSLAQAPVPEPGTWALMAAGLGVVAWLARRRRQA